MKIKICGISNLDDALAVSRAGADYVGMIFAPKSPRAVSPQDALAIARARGSGEISASLVGVFQNAPAEEILRRAKEFSLSAVQLHGGESEEFVREISGRGFEIWKAFWLESLADVEAALASAADRILADSRSGGKLGGTGKTANWALARRVSERRSVVLAGGISPDNARRAASRVAPFALDLNSSVEISPRKKDAEKISKFLEKIKNGNI